jgi:hypothetical protein
LGLNAGGATATDVLRAWRRQMRLAHPDKTCATDALDRSKILNHAKEEALAKLGTRDDSQRLAEWQAKFEAKVNEKRREWEAQQARDTAACELRCAQEREKTREAEAKKAERRQKRLARAERRRIRLLFAAQNEKKDAHVAVASTEKADDILPWATQED